MTPSGTGDDGSIGPDRSLPLAFVDDVDDPTLAAPDRHHLERVRRLRPGDRFSVGDGAGRFRVVRLATELELDGDIHAVDRLEPTITVGFALTKGDKPDLVVQKLTELGVDVVVPFIGARSVVRWDPAKAARNTDRWRSIAREAAAQCHRAWLPTVAELTAFAEVADAPGVALAHPEGGGPTLAHPTVLIGPEGGWSIEEESAVSGRIGLGPHVLRAETAAVAAGALLAALRGDHRGPLVRST